MRSESYNSFEELLVKTRNKIITFFITRSKKYKKCRLCNGVGFLNCGVLLLCTKCNGEGYLDWITSIRSGNGRT